MSTRLDIKDAIRRIRGIGNLVNLNEDSNFAKIANGLLSMERARLDEAVESTKKTLGDWAGRELDQWWGTILSIERLPGIERADDFIGDPTYISRIKKFMEAGSRGISLESVRIAAEAGAGSPFSVSKAGSRVILTPLEPLTPAARQGALRAVHRIAPARAIIEISEGELYSSTAFGTIWSDSVYVGDDPTEIRANGPEWKSPNAIVMASADKWGTAEDNSGTPGLLMRGGTWTVPEMGFGEQATLTLGVSKEVINNLKFTISAGSWRAQVYLGDMPLFVEDINSSGWNPFDRSFPFLKGEFIKITFTNLLQRENGLGIKGTYAGSVVTNANKKDWLAAGGGNGENDRDVVIADAENIQSGGEWVSKPQSDPSFEVPIYMSVGGAPQIISALKMKTRTPGAIFRISYSNDDIDELEEYPNLNWSLLPGYYKMVNGRIDTEPFKAKHVRLTITNLRPLLLKEFYSEN